MLFHPYFIFTACGFIMNMVSAIWFGPIFGKAIGELLSHERGRRFDRWCHVYSYNLCIIATLACNVFRIGVYSYVLSALKVLAGGITCEALTAFAALHIGLTVTTAHADIWEHRNWKLIAIVLGGQTVSTLAGVLLLLQVMPTWATNF